MADKVQGVMFNMALMFYEELHDLRMFKSKAYILGDLVGYRDALEEIFSAISFKLSKEEQKAVIDIMNNANALMNAQKLEAKSHYRLADMEIMKLMDKYKMIFPDNTLGGGLPDIRKRYGLEEGTK